MDHQPVTTVQPATLFPSFALYHLRLVFALGARRHTLPTYLGSTLRGVFAASFRQVVCVTQAPVCDGCLLLQRCPYPYIFETPPPLHVSEVLQKRFRQAPRPYIFDIPLVYSGDAELEVGLILVGKALDFLPYFLYVLHETGQRGLGRANVPYRLLSVCDGSAADGAGIFHTDHGIVGDHVQPITVADMQHPDDVQVQQLTMEFLTPLRVKKYGNYQESSDRLTFATLLALLLGRLSALDFFHCGGTWETDDFLPEVAQDVQIIAKDFALQLLERYSNRRQQKLPLHGLVGSIRFAGPVAPFLPLLRLGEHLHIGAGAAFGLGRYRLR